MERKAVSMWAATSFFVGLLQLAGNISASRPHLVFFLSDDQGNHDIGFHSANITRHTLTRLPELDVS